MALVNALFPGAVFLDDDEDIDVTPYSEAMLHTIRLVIYTHLMQLDPFSQRAFSVLVPKLTTWLDGLAYAELRQTLVQFTEESKKLEEVCFETINTIQQQRDSLTSTTPSGSSSSKSKQRATSGSSFKSKQQSEEQDSAAPTPLLLAIPGREILGAETNPAAFVSSVVSQENMVNEPTTLSNTEFLYHPIGKHLKLSASELAGLALMVPKTIVPDSDV